MRHKHADLIHAWAEGAEIEMKSRISGNWLPLDGLGIMEWNKDTEYRIKPEPKTDVVRFWEAKSEGVSVCGSKDGCAKDNLKLTFDGETGKLKSAEAI